MNEFLTSVKALFSLIGKGNSNAIVAVACAVWLTVWVGMRVRDLEIKWLKFERDQQWNWTVQMMAQHDRIAASLTNGSPDSWGIFWDQRAKFNMP